VAVHPPDIHQEYQPCIRPDLPLPATGPIRETRRSSILQRRAGMECAGDGRKDEA
jgi:hypothetical protein